MPQPQALREKKSETILKHGGKRWRVDMQNVEKMKQYPVPQPALRYKWRHVRFVVVERSPTPAPANQVAWAYQTGVLAWQWQNERP